MNDKSKVIFGNSVSNKTYKKAIKSKEKFIKKFSDDSNIQYNFSATYNNVLNDIGTMNLVSGNGMQFEENAIIVGNIRMGFGHYRISMALASAANSMGLKPYWFDLNSFKESTCTKIISHQNDLYSKGSRLSQKYSVFNKFFWEPMNSEGFRKLSYNSVDQKNAEIMANLLKTLPKDIPFVATHVWPAQAAIHAGLTNVVNAIPDNWPMALHLAEGSIHTVQTQSSFLGYKALRGMDKSELLPMPDNSVKYVGHYVDDELVKNINNDCKKRIARVKNHQKRRYLLTVGGAGAQQDLFEAIISFMLPEIKNNKAVLYINVGDHINVLNEMTNKIPELSNATKHINNYDEAKEFSMYALDNDVNGIHTFADNDIFSAVYITNLLMRSTDVLITKPSELSFYPVPKLMIKRVGGHELWGSIRSAEVGDGTYEIDTKKEIFSMLKLMQNGDEVIPFMCENIIKNNEYGLYNGAYNAVKLAVNKKG